MQSDKPFHKSQKQNLKVRPHYVARQNATICSFATRQNETICSFAARQICSAYAANAIASTWKKNFLQTFFMLQKLWNKTGDLVWFFSQTGWYHLETPMPRDFLWWDRQFADRIFRPRNIKQHAAAKPTQHPYILATWRDLAALCCCVPRGIVWTYL